MSVMDTNKVPYRKKPCSECPIRKDTLKGWLGNDKIAAILKADCFVCHKNTSLQCAGHMLLKKQENAFVQIAERLSINLKLEGEELIFDTEDDCIAHHSHDHLRQKSD